jgi:hypothetical protein
MNSNGKTDARRRGENKSLYKSMVVVLCLLGAARNTTISMQTTKEIDTSNPTVLTKTPSDNSAPKESGPICPDDQHYTWLDDRDVLPGRNTKKIPNILYQTAKGRCVDTDVYNATIRNWLESSEYSLGYKFYDDPRMDAYLMNETRWKSIFPGLSLALKCIEHVQLPVMKADLWRYILLWERGGIFADLDVRLDANQSLLQHLRDHDDDAVFVQVQDRPGRPRVLSQWLFAVSPYHPLLYYAAEQAISLVLKARRAIPIQHTGPRALYDATDRFLIHQGSAVSRWLVVDQVYSEQLDSQVHSGRNLSFRVTPRSWAKNQAFPHEKNRLYALMNMTHYKDNQKGKKPYGNGATCLEFLGGILQEDRNAFHYSGATYSFQNPMPDRIRPA